MRAQIVRDFLRPRLIDSDLSLVQRRIRCLELVSNLLPGQCSLGKTAFRTDCGRKQPHTQTTQETCHEASPDFLCSDRNTALADATGDGALLRVGESVI